jgi:hypothetical protein
MCLCPDLFHDPTQVRKSCWTCSSSIPYRKGWCDDCWKYLSPELRDLLLKIILLSDKTFQGSVYQALSDAILAAKRPPVVFRPKPKKLSLDDLEIEL